MSSSSECFWSEIEWSVSGDDDLNTNTKSVEITNDTPLESLEDRTGKWTIEEEEYASKLIELFIAGRLIDGSLHFSQTLRSYLARKLNCKPMRISKKYTKQHLLGKRYEFGCLHNISLVNEEFETLKRLERKFLEKDIDVQMNRKKRRQYRKKSEEKKKKTSESSNNEDSTTRNEDWDFIFE
mmetsp:Transcript_34593/g.35272  ORF Transcript_34593/g.35272 Transcript_34593/m.35272 type:complete len:182 (+) Transcript_34593:30-575(+)